MMNFINSIPTEVGWIIVGIVYIGVAILFVKLITSVYKMLKDE